MISFVTPPQFIDGRLNRREWLRIGGLAGLGLRAGVGSASASALSRPAGFGRAKSVILVYANGGQSQLETWDPKPDAPREIRGEFQAIATSVPGTFLCEHMPRLARLANRYTIVRNLSHDDLDHGSATYLSLTGRYHPKKSSNPLPSPSDFPTSGAVLKRVRPSRQFPYSAVHVNGPALAPELAAPGQDGGFLRAEYDPLVIGDMTQEPSFLPDLRPPPELPPIRIESRRSLLASIDANNRRLAADRAVIDMHGQYRQAYELLSSPGFQSAFDLASESEGLRARYGRHRSGQACLLARRLVEAGVPWITVVWNHSGRGQDTTPDQPDRFGWDTHNDIFDVMKQHLLPRFDESFSALLEDLDQRGLLDTTLVVCMGEFGRAPRVAMEAKFQGQSPGRKHWANVYSIVMAGAGVGRGCVLGASDRIGGHPVSDRFGPWDVAATMWSALGVDPAAEYFDHFGRPFPISIGRPIRELYQG